MSAQEGKSNPRQTGLSEQHQCRPPPLHGGATAPDEERLRSKIVSLGIEECFVCKKDRFSSLFANNPSLSLQHLSNLSFVDQGIIVLLAAEKEFRRSSTPKGEKKFRTKGGFLADFLRTKSGRPETGKDKGADFKPIGGQVSVSFRSEVSIVGGKADKKGPQQFTD